MDTQTSIQLGQAQNQATQILKDRWHLIIPADREETYKASVRKIYQWNSDLEAELENSLKTREEPVKSNSSVSATPIDTKVSKQAQPSLIKKPSINQKNCPKCNLIIPKTWLNHGVCGWKVTQ